MRSLLAVALVAASASAASAGTYLGLGIGTSASPSGDLPMTSNDGNHTGRLILGSRFGRFSVEGAAERYGFFRSTAAYQGTMLAIAGKYSLPLGDNFEVYGRGGLQRTWLSTDANTLSDFAGNGWLLGAGFEYRLDLGVGASVFVDYEHTSTGLVNQDDMRTTKDESIGMWTLGATIAI